MRVILPNEILEVLKCSVCKNYLSCGPTENVHNSSNGSSIMCGRCNSENENTAPSLFNKVAPYLLFPCIYRYEGCNQLFQYEDVKNHEKICSAKKAHEGYFCPTCVLTEGSPIPLLRLIDHYKTHHESLVLKEPSVTVNLEKFKTSHYLYCDTVNNYIFFIFVHCTGDKLFLNASVVGKEANQVMQLLDTIEDQRFCTEFNDNSKVFQINTENLEIFTGKFQFKMLSVPALILFDRHDFVVAASPYPLKFPKIIFARELINQTGSKQGEYKLSTCLTKLENVTDKSSIDIRCSFCENYFWDCKFTSPLLYICGEGICKICCKCFDGTYRNCVKHQSNFYERSVSQIFTIYFCCRFNCGLFFEIGNLQYHEYYCGNFSEIKYVKQQFRLSTENDSTSFIKGNCVFMPDYVRDRIKKWYIVTHDGFKCILDISYTNFRYTVNHNYDKSKYYVMIRICQNGVVREELNEFKIDWYPNDQDYYIAIFFKKYENKPYQII